MTPTPTRHPDEPIARWTCLWDRAPSPPGTEGHTTLDAIATVAVESPTLTASMPCPSSVAERLGFTKWRSTGTCPTRTCCWQQP